MLHVSHDSLSRGTSEINGPFPPVFTRMGSLLKFPPTFGGARCWSTPQDIALVLRSRTLLVMRTNQENTNFGSASYHPRALRQRDPPSFSGVELDDVEGWIDGYGRVARHNRWGDGTKLVNVVFSLSGIASTRFLNHGADFGDWTTFSSRFQDLFTRPPSRTADAKHRLSSRTQQGREILTTCIQDLLVLSIRADSSMSNPEKVRHIPREIRDDAFSVIVLKKPTSVAEVVILCESLQDAQNHLSPFRTICVVSNTARQKHQSSQNYSTGVIYRSISHSPGTAITP